MDDDASFLNDEAQRIYHEWGFQSNDVKRRTEWDSKISNATHDLFGNKNMTILNLEDKTDLKLFSSLIKENKKHSMLTGEWWGNGLIIVTTHAVGTKAVETLVSSSKGEIIKKAKPEVMLAQLLNRVKLNKATRDIVEKHVGREYGMLVSAIREIETYSIDKQQSLSADEVIIMLPTIPGSIPPWEFADLMMNGNAASSIEKLERILIHDHPLVPLVFIKRKTDMLFKLKLLLMSGLWKSAEQASVMGERNSPNVWQTSDIAKRLSLETIESITTAVVALDIQMKGYSAIDPNTLLKNYVVMIAHAIRYDRPILERKIRL